MFFKEGEEGRGETKRYMGPANEQGEHRSFSDLYISPVPLRYHLHAMEKQVKNKQVNSMLW